MLEEHTSSHHPGWDPGRKKSVARKPFSQRVVLGAREVAPGGGGGGDYVAHHTVRICGKIRA